MIPTPRSRQPSAWSRRFVVGLAVVTLFAAPGAVTEVSAKGRDNAIGDVVKAARLLSAWQYEEARALINQMMAADPKSAEHRYLRAELAFVDGDYAQALELIKGIGDREAGGNVGALRTLATSTLAVTGGFAKKTSKQGHFVIHYPPGKDEVIVDLAAEVLEAAHASLSADFGFAPTEVIRVELLTKPADLAGLSTLTEKDIETTGTIALCKYGKLMVVSPRATMLGYPWMDTLVHEYVHYVVSRVSADTVPVWLHEGLARFQQTRWRGGPEIAKLTPSDEYLLANGLKKSKLITFDEMHPSMAKLPSQEAAALAFAEVFTMVAFIHKKVGYEGIRAAIAAQKQGASAKRAVADALGTNWIGVEKDWKAYLRGLDLKANKALSGRAGSRRIRFDKGGEDSDNVGIEEVASEKAKKHTRLGGMLRARKMTAAAAVEYERALAAAGMPDPFVSGKLSRTYLELQRWDDAIKLAQPIVELDENDPFPMITLGLAYLATGAHGEARTVLEMALRINPFDPSVRCSLAEIYGALGEEALASRERDACARVQN